MTNQTTDKRIERIAALLSDMFEISAVYRSAKSVQLSLVCRFERTKSVAALKDRLQVAGYQYDLNDSEDILILQVDPKPKPKIPALNIILFFLTLCTVYLIPVWFKNGMNISATQSDLLRGAGLEFTLAMISILFVHEMGHFIAGRRRHIITSWPYFIPAPNLIGTFGAVIKSKSPIWNRRDLIEVGASGPITGWIVAVGWLAYGLTQSTMLPPQIFAPGELLFTLEYESIVMQLTTLATIGPLPDGYFYKLSEAAFAGWVGLLVTAINMLPMGQLDGGHVVYGLFGRQQHRLGLATVVGLAGLGFLSPIWWVFAGIGIVFGIKHPPTINDGQPISKAARIMGIVSLIILVLSFTPVPFR